MLKRVIAGALSAAICTSSLLSNGTSLLANVNPGSNENAASDHVSNLDFESSNSLGNFITHAAEEDQTVKTLANSDIGDSKYMVTGLDFDPATGKIAVTSTQPCDSKLIVSFIDEDNDELFTSVEGNVEEGRLKRTELSIDTSKLGEYFIIKAQLFDGSYRSAGNPFVVKKYTKEMADIRSKTTKDFDQDRVINFDEDETNNFVVLSDDTIIAESSEGKNELVSSDFENNVFVFENADDTLKNLEKGEFFYIQPSPESIISISVRDVNVDGDMVTVSGSDKIDDMLAFVKFESHSDPRDAVLDMETADEGIERTDTDFEETGVMTFDMTQYLLSYSGSNSSSFSLSKDVPLGDSGIDLGASVSVSFTQNFEFYKEWGYTYVYYELQADFSFSITLGVDNGDNDVLKHLDDDECSPRIGSVSIPTSIPGATVKISLDIVLELEASIGVTFSATSTYGFQYDTDDGMESIDKTKENSKGISVKLEGEAFVGLKISASLDAVDLGFITLLEFSLYSKVGLDITGALEVSYAHNGESGSFSNTAFVCVDTSGDTKHACDTCLKGDVSFAVKAGVEFKLFSGVVDADWEIASFSTKLFDWYLSLDNLGLVAGAAGLPPSWIFAAGLAKFGIGTCPNIAYKTTFNVTATDPDGNTFVPNVEILVDGKVSTGVVSGSGAAVYCRSGKHSVDIIINGKTVKKSSFHINDKTKTLNYNFDLNKDDAYTASGENSNDGPAIATTTVTTNSVERNVRPTKAPSADHHCLETGALGDNIMYMLYPQGYLYIFGHGDMYDFSSSPFKTPSSIKYAILENAGNEKDGKVITSIGNNVFLNCSSMESVNMPQTIKRIGVNAFRNCSSLSKLSYDEFDYKTSKKITVEIPEGKLIMPKAITTVEESAFNSCSSFTDVVIPNTIPTLAHYVFADCTNLKEVSVPETVTTIGNYVFNNCSSLEKAEILGEKATIGFHIFSGCKSLKEMTLPFAGFSLAGVEAEDSKQYLDDYFNSGNSTDYFEIYNPDGWRRWIPKSLKKITILSGTRIPHYAFYRFTGVTEIIIPDKITSVGNYAFAECNSLKSAPLSPSLVSIGAHSFENCSSAYFQDVDFPESLTSIGGYAFSNCDGLTSINVPATVQNIGEYAFNSCDTLTKADIYGGSNGIGGHIFSECRSLESLTLPFAGFSLAGVEAENSNQYLDDFFNNGNSTDYIEIYNPDGWRRWIPKSLKNITILGGTKIPNYAFYYFTGVESITIPESITSIGNQAYNGCKSMTSFYIPKNVKTIGEYAFCNCNSAVINTYSLPKTLETIGNYAFSGCASIKNVTIPKTVKSIGNYVFNDCTALETAKILGDETTIGFHIFSGCKSLEEMTLPFAGFSLANVEAKDSKQYLDDYFNNGNSTDYIEIYNPDGWRRWIPKTLNKITILGGTRIPNYAFYRFKGVTDIVIPDEITSVGNYAFAECNSLKSAPLSPSLVSIGAYSFENCSSAYFQDVDFPESLTSIGGYAFSNCDGLTSINVPATVLNIGEYAFNSCDTLTKADIYGGSNGIGGHIFSECRSLESLTLPFAGFSLAGVEAEDSKQYLDDYFNSGNSTDYFEIYNPDGWRRWIPKSLKSITILGGTRIPHYAFYRFTGVTDIVIPDKITSIGNYAFAECKSLKSAPLSPSIASIGAHSFENCSSAYFQDVDFPESLTSIGGYAFSNCDGLTSINVPATVQNIGEYAFNSCDTLTKADIYGGSNGIGGHIFSECRSLESLTLPFAGFSLANVEAEDSKQYLDDFFNNGNSTDYIEIYNPDGWRRWIPKSLKNITVKGGKKIPKYAFFKMLGVKNVYLPKNITAIDDNAFNGCAGIENVFYPSTKAEWEKNVAIGVNNEAINGKVRFLNDNGVYNTTTSTTTSGTTTSTTSKTTSTTRKAVTSTTSKTTTTTRKATTSTTSKITTTTRKATTSTTSKTITTTRKAATSTTSKITTTTRKATTSTTSKTTTTTRKATTSTTSKTTTTTRKATTSTTSKITPTTRKTTIYITSKITLAPTTTSSKSTTSTTSTSTTSTTSTTTKATTTTQTTTRKPFAPVTTEFDPQIEEEIKEEKNERLKITGELTAKPMTKDEIVSAGIDVDDPDNYHYFNYKVEMTFHDQPFVFTKCEAIPIDPPTVTIGPNISITPPAPKIYYPHHPDPVGPGEPVHLPEINATAIYFEYEEQEMYIIIYGDDKWLKEFYDVQLIIFNSDKETLEDCSATLNVPVGLTLCNSDQTQFVGDLLPHDVKDIHWYLRGDVAGEYSISALFKGTNDGDEFSYSFTSKENIHVYANDALKLTIACPAYSYCGYNYPIRIAMTNVSDMPIYNLQHRVKNTEHGYYSYKHVYKDGPPKVYVSKENLGKSVSASVNIDKLLPGESAIIDLTITDMWRSPLQQYLENCKLFIDALSLISSNPLGLFFAGLTSRFIDGITVVHVLDSICVTTLKDSTTSVPYEIIITNNLDEIAEDNTFDVTEAVMESVTDQLPEGIQKFLYGGQVFYKTFNFMKDATKEEYDDWKKVQNGEMDFNQFANKYYIEYRDFVAGNASRYVAAGGNGKKSGYATVGSDIYNILSKPANCSNATAYVTDSNGNKIVSNSTATRSPKPGMNKVFASAEPDFEFEFLSGDFEYKDGVYTFSDDCLFRIKANKPDETYILHLVTDEGYEEEYPFITVPEHECTGGHFCVVSAPDSQNDGIAMQFCEVCGKPIKTRHIPNSFCAMLSDGQMFQNVYQAAEFAKENYDEVELSLVGNIKLDRDLVIPENVTLIITPFTNITYTNSAHIVVDGEYKDFTTDKDTDIYENIVLEYWDGRTEIMPVKYGEEVTELPALCETCGFTGWYTDAEFTEPFVPFTSGDKNHSKIYYSDVHHSFKTSGKCSVCGELKNGKDAFQKVGLSIGDDVEIKYVITLTEKALADKALRVKFEMSDGTTKTQYLSDAIDNGNGTYTFTCSVPFSKLDENIKAQVYYSNNVKSSYLDYSAKKYTDLIIANSNSFDKVTVDSIKALVNFSGYIQIFTGVAPEDAVNADLGMPLDDVNVEISDEFNAVKTTNSDVIDINSASLSVDTLSNINIYFELAEGANVNDYKFTIGDKEVKPKKSGSAYTISMVGISPDNFDKMYTFKAESKSDASDYVSVEYSCLTYAKKIIETSSDDTVKNAMKALYFYNQEIEKYVSQTKED